MPTVRSVFEYAVSKGGGQATAKTDWAQVEARARAVIRATAGTAPTRRETAPPRSRPLVPRRAPMSALSRCIECSRCVRCAGMVLGRSLVQQLVIKRPNVTFTPVQTVVSKPSRYSRLEYLSRILYDFVALSSKRWVFRFLTTTLAITLVVCII